MRKQVAQLQDNFAEMSLTFTSLAAEAPSLSTCDILSQSATLHSSMVNMQDAVAELLAPARRRFLGLARNWDGDEGPAVKWAQKDPLAVPLLISVVSSVSIYVDQRLLALSVLDKIGLPEQAVPCVVRALRDPDLRQRARNVLRKKRPQSQIVVKALCDALKNPDLVDQAAYTLSDLRDAAQSAVPALLETIKHHQVPDMGEVLLEIGGNDKETVKALKNMAREGKAESRMYALEVLYDLQWSSDLTRRLISLLKVKEASTGVLYQAIELLGAVGEKEDLPREAQKALLALCDHQPLRTAIAHTMAVVSKTAAKKHIIPLLVNDLSDPAPQVRKATVEALPGLPLTQAVLPALTSLLTDPHEEVRFAVLNVLGKFGRKVRGVAKALEEALNGDGAMRDKALRVIDQQLIRPSDQAAPLLIQVASDKISPVRDGAIAVLGMMGPAALPCVPILLEALKDEKVSDVSAETLKQLACHLSPEERKQVRKAISAYEKWRKEDLDDKLRHE